MMYLSWRPAPMNWLHDILYQTQILTPDHSLLLPHSSLLTCFDRWHKLPSTLWTTPWLWLPGSVYSRDFTEVTCRDLQSLYLEYWVDLPSIFSCHLALADSCLLFHFFSDYYWGNKSKGVQHYSYWDTTNCCWDYQKNLLMKWITWSYNMKKYFQLFLPILINTTIFFISLQYISSH